LAAWIAGLRRQSAFLRLCLLSFAICSAVFGGNAVAEEARVALVIGNGAYTTIRPLKNAVGDARLIRDALRRIGFEVIYREDVDEVELQRAIADFGARMSEMGHDGVALFYYAGHGVQSGGENFLLPTDIAIDREADLRVKATRAVDVLAQMQSAPPRVKIVILDACRDNPFAVKFAMGARQGLADIALGNFEFTLGFAATAGKSASDGEGPNGPYAVALARHIVTPDAELFEVFRHVADDVSNATSGRQLPEFRSTIRHEVYLVPTKPQIAQQPAVETPEPASPVKVAAAETVVGKWCQASRGAGAGTSMLIRPDALDYNVQGVKVEYSVRSIRPTAAGTVQVRWLRGDVPVVLEFGDFAADGQAMTQLRGRNEVEQAWHDYDLRYQRC
jgi:hypothetical protein